MKQKAPRRYVQCDVCKRTFVAQGFPMHRSICGKPIQERPRYVLADEAVDRLPITASAVFLERIAAALEERNAMTRESLEIEKRRQAFFDNVTPQFFEVFEHMKKSVLGQQPSVVLFPIRSEGNS